MLDLTKFNTLTFDCYGTLIDWERGILAELRPWVNRGGHQNLDDNTILETFGTIEAECEAATPAKLYPEILADVHRRLAERWDIKAPAGEAEEFGRSVGRWPAFADSATSLQYLKRYYKLVILSNVDRASFARSNEKLAVVFDRIITAQDIGSYKPSLRNFEYALSDLEGTLGTRKTDILHTAQSIFHDVVPARTVGLATMWINRRKTIGGWGATPSPQAPGALTTPDMEVGSMADLVVLHQAHLRGESV
jgi:2-haloalkanoic acid dehalogenase type II